MHVEYGEAGAPRLAHTRLRSAHRYGHGRAGVTERGVRCQWRQLGRMIVGLLARSRFTGRICRASTLMYGKIAS